MSRPDRQLGGAVDGRARRAIPPPIAGALRRAAGDAPAVTRLTRSARALGSAAALPLIASVVAGEAPRAVPIATRRGRPVTVTTRTVRPPAVTTGAVRPVPVSPLAGGPLALTAGTVSTRVIATRPGRPLPVATRTV
ncbi:hypothetical protein GCM10009819_00010 [Agromyces tropicus]|uniref:Uncharacterized protein n=1 Tax=Agromyces tropicus TaxID=555371 RepID=A0ABN2TWH9_9MICO